MVNKSSAWWSRWWLVFLAGILLGAVPCVIWFSIGRAPASKPRPIAPPHAVHRTDEGKSKIKVDGKPEPKPKGTNGIRIYYDGVHGARHLFDRDNRRYRTDYHTVSGWYRLLQALRTAGYSIETETYANFDAASLEPYDVFMVGEQTYHARFMSDAERDALIEWVRQGGGLFITAEHTNAHYMGDVFNRIAKDLPVKARFDAICDTELAHPSSPCWIAFADFTKHPVTEGVSDYSFYNGCSLDTEYGVIWSSNQSWSDRFNPKAAPIHNGNKRRDNGEQPGPLAGVAAFEFGKGRVVVIGDHNALTNTALYKGDHHRFAMNAIRWLAHAEDRDELVNWQYPSGYDILIHTGAGSDFKLHQKSGHGRFYTAYGFLSKEAHLRPWASKKLRADDELLILGAPTRAYEEKELEIIDQVLQAGKPVIWLATLKSLDSEAAMQLKERYGFSYTFRESDIKGRRPYVVHGPKEWTHGIFRIFMTRGTPELHVEGLSPIVQLTWGSEHIEHKQWEREEVLNDLISVKEVGPGRFYLFTPFGVFDDNGLRGLYIEGADVVRQQMAELVLRTAKIALGDPIVYVD
jgi:hypothetical protein